MASIESVDLVSVKTWAEAALKSKGYQDKSLVLDLIEAFKLNVPNRIHRNKISTMSNRMIHLLAAFRTIASVDRLKLQIQDYGGGNGQTCDFLRDANPKYLINYTVYETTEIASGYNAHSKGLGINFLDIKNFGKEKCDLVIISCTLQYTKNYKEILEVSSKIAEHTLILRLPLTNSKMNNYYIQHNPSGTYSLSNANWPITFFSKNLFLNEIEKNFKIVFHITDSEEDFVFKGSVFPMNTLLLTSKNR